MPADNKFPDAQLPVRLHQLGGTALRNKQQPEPVPLGVHRLSKRKDQPQWEVLLIEAHDRIAQPQEQTHHLEDRCGRR